MLYRKANHSKKGRCVAFQIPVLFFLVKKKVVPDSTFFTLLYYIYYLFEHD